MKLHSNLQAKEQNKIHLIEYWRKNNKKSQFLKVTSSLWHHPDKMLKSQEMPINMSKCMVKQTECAHFSHLGGRMETTDS